MPEKEPNADIWPQILAIADSYKLAIALAFLQAFKNYKKQLNTNRLEKVIRSNDIKNVDKFLNGFMLDGNPLKIPIKNLMDDVGKKIINEYSLKIDIKDVAMQKYIDKHVADLVKDISEDTRKQIKDIIRDGWEKEINPKLLSSNIKEVIGLNQRQQKALVRYEQKLLTDKTLQAKYNMKTEEGFNKFLKKVKELKEEEYKVKLAYRAQMIARTESIDIANEGSRTMYEEMAKRNPIIRDEYELEWILTPDDRLCSRCRAMRGARSSFNGTFEGNIRRPTLHPQCRCCIVCSKRNSKDRQSNVPKEPPENPKPEKTPINPTPIKPVPKKPKLEQKPKPISEPKPEAKPKLPEKVPVYQKPKIPEVPKKPVDNKPVNIIAPKGMKNQVKITLDNYNAMPKKLKSFCSDIELYDKDPKYCITRNAELTKMYGKECRVGAWYDREENKIHCPPGWDNKLEGVSKDFMAHELSHSLDKNYSLSNSKKWYQCIMDDKKASENTNFINDGFATEYARNFAKRQTSTHIYSEDFADSIKLYVIDKETFKLNFPNKSKYIRELLGE